MTKPKRSNGGASSRSKNTNQQVDQAAQVALVRKKCVEAFVLNVNHKNDVPFDNNAYLTELESQLFQLMGNPQRPNQLFGYHRKFVQLLYNLKRFPELMNRYTPSELVFLESNELNPEVKVELANMKEQNENYKKIQNLQITGTDDDDGGDKDEKDQMHFVICRKCRGQDICSITRQLRSADEPASVFHSCNKCGYHWREG